MACIYFFLWLIFNGRVNFETLFLGVIISVAIDVFIKKTMRVRVSGGSFFTVLKLFPGMVLYFFVLLYGIIKANIIMVLLTLSPNPEIEPCIIKMHTPLKSQAARVTLANSITLTPGTITISLEGNELLVHALNHDIARGLENSIFEKILIYLEGIARA